MNKRAVLTFLAALIVSTASAICPAIALGEPYLDNETQHSNQDPDHETRRSDHFRVVWGHFNRDGSGMSEERAQGNLQMFEHLWQRNIVELGLNDMGESAILEKRDGNKYRTNFHFLMTWPTGGGGAYMSMDGNGYSYAMANPGYCRFDPPSGATPHELGHAWEGQARGFNGSDSSGFWWECTANWFQLQLLNSYPGPGGIIWNSMYYPCHGRDYYDHWLIWEAAREDPRYGSAWVNRVWTDATPEQQVGEYIIERMMRVENGTGAADRPGAVKDLWGDMAKKAVTWDYERQRWFAAANWDESSPDWYWQWYQRCRTPLVKMPGTAGWYRPERSHTPQEYGFNIIPLIVNASSTVSCNFQPQCDYARQSDWRACLVAVSNNNDARYGTLWNKGTNSITLSSDEKKLYLVVIATPKPMKIGGWDAYLTDAGLQFPYSVSFTNANPGNVSYAAYTGTHSHHPNGGGLVQTGASVALTAYVGPNAQVLDGASVQDYARIEDYAVVRNSTQVRDNAVVSGHAEVSGNAQVYGNAKVRDWARVFGYAEVYENARVIEHANCGDGNETTHTRVYGSAVVKGTTYVYNASTFAGCLIVEGDSANGNGTDSVADHGVHFGWQWGQNPSVFANLADNGYVWAQHTFERQNAAFAMDTFGINHGFLMNGALGAVDPDRGGLVLPLDGVNQYVELHNSVNDFRETAITAWVKWTGSANDQRVWSMGDGASRQMYLTPKDGTTGKLRFVISNGTATQYLDGAAAIPANTWTHVAVTFGSPVFNTTTRTWSATGTLYVNGAQVATLAGMLVPDALCAANMENANYLGRGNAGNYFQGYIDDFRVYMKTLSSSAVSAVYSAAVPAPVTVVADTTAPTPNAATWLAPPAAISDSAITMSASAGTDESGWVEYYFTCTSGGGHDSGWVSFNKYADVGLTPGTSYTYTVKMRDRNGNTTAGSEALSATTQTCTAPAASFAYGPVGIADGQIRMAANKQTSPSGLVLYKFDRTSPTIATSGWRATPTWTDTGLVTGTKYYYKVTVRDGRGNTSAPSAAASSLARDLAPPQLPALQAAHWQMMPYATIDNKVCMTAEPILESGAQVYYECTSGNGPDSGWVDAAASDDGGKSYYAQWTAPNPLPDGTYSYRYRVRDAAGNESGYSTTYSARITPTTGYHACTLDQLAGMQDDALVSFSATVMRVNENDYAVKDVATGASITVKPNAGNNDGSNNEATDPGLALRNISVQGHLYTLGGVRVVTYATVAAIGDPSSYTISGKVSSTGGAGVSGATVYFSDTPDASGTAIVTATTDANGNYSRRVTPGTWYVAAGHAVYNTSPDQAVTVTTGGIVNVNFTLVANAVVSGKVKDKLRGTPVSGASVSFSRSPNAYISPVFVVTTDTEGNYSQPLQNGTWYVCATAPGHRVSADRTLTLSGANVSNFDLRLAASSTAFFVQRDTATQGTWINQSTGARVYGKDGYQMGGIAASLPDYISSIGVSGCATHTWRGVSTANPVRDLQVPSSPYTSRIASGWYSNGGTITLNVTDNAPHLLAIYCEDPDATNRRQMLDILDAETNEFLDSQALTTQFDQGVWLQWKITGSVKIMLTTHEGANAVFMGVFFDPDSTLTYHTITASAGAGGTISPSGSISAAHGFSKVFSITPNRGYAISRVIVDGVDQGAESEYTFASVTTNHTISAEFVALPAYTVSATAGAGGKCTPSGVTTLYQGESQTYTITSEFLYNIQDVLVDSVSQGPVTTYTFSNVSGSHTIVASFVAKPLANVSGSVRLSGGTGTEAAINVYSDAGCTALVATTTSSSSGAYALSLPQGSTYYLRATKPGYVPSSPVTAIIGTQDLGAVDLYITARRYEAEDPANTRVNIGGNIAYAHASGGYAIGKAGWGSYGGFTVNNINVAAGGTYKLTVGIAGYGWKNNLDRATYVNVNGTQVGGAYWPATDPGTFSVDVPLAAGNNSITIWTPANAWGPHWDCIDVALLPAAGPQTINAFVGTGGSITPGGAVSVLPGSDQTFTISPDPGRVIFDVVVDGVSRGPVNSYTFTNVLEGHDIYASFARPVGMNNRSLLTDPMVPGRAVTVWGRVKSVGSGTFEISDGHSVNVVVVGPASGITTSMTVVVTGIVSADRSITAQTIQVL